MQLPEHCRALIVEPEPMQAFALDCLLAELGCRRMGPVGSLRDLEKLLAKRRPSFTLVEADLNDELEPIADCLTRSEVPFALMAIGPANQRLDRSETFRHRPRIGRPFHAPTLQAAACGLYRQSLCRAIASADANLKQGRLRLARQLRLIKRMAAAGQDAASADDLALEYGRLPRTMGATRQILARRLNSLADQMQQSC
jgi:hypothetical protein